MNKWLEQFCKDVFVDPINASYAARIVNGGVDGFIARHGAPADESAHKLWLEQGIWFTWDTKLLDGKQSDEDKRVAVLERLEAIHRIRLRLD